MARTTETEVKQIIDTDLTDEQVAPFVTTANVLVTDVLAGQGYGENLLHEIEKYLAAHLLTARDPRVSKEKVGTAEATYQGKFGEGLKSTTYGQHVLLLDRNKVFAELSASKGAAIMETIM
jgi:hypothetical protein